MHNSQIGKLAERAAASYLKSHGLKLVEENFSCKLGEIDLIMSKATLLIFVEVRYRANPNYGTGADSISRSKQQKIIRTAKMFLQKNGHLWNQYRFDVVSIGNDINWIPGAFTLD